MVRKMIFVKNWSTLLQGLITMVRRFEKPFTNHVSRLWFGTNLFLSEYWVESSLSYKLRLFKKKQSSCFSFRLKGNISPKFSKLCKLIAIVTDKHQFAHAVYHPPAILLATEVNATHIYSSKSWHTFVHAGAHLRKPHAGAHLRKP
jgi:hypothetical protein